MDFLEILMDFLNAYSRNLHLPVNVSTIAFQAISTPSITKCMTQFKLDAHTLSSHSSCEVCLGDFKRKNLVICRRLELHYTITGIKSPCYIVESVAQRSQRRACNPEVGSSSLPRLTSFDLKKSKGQIDQWRVMDFLDFLTDFLNAYSRNLHLP